MKKPTGAAYIYPNINKNQNNFFYKILYTIDNPIINKFINYAGYFNCQFYAIISYPIALKLKISLSLIK